jgi:peroxiredoxin
VLVSWATWCTECDEELERFEQFAGSPDADGLQIVAVNIDAADVQDEIDAKIERHHLSMALWRDPRNAFKRAFGALGVPTTVVLDRDGQVAGTFPGAVDFDDDAVVTALDSVRGPS